ncbi:hypothetical protein Ddye_015597 [Dipteronia dyeriana]|uniref:Uncharacterized protein n=1 Tax=Dipteronia dyeriana TaxID=168575 RepID=A0AAD9WZA5_9ROSI|nr:hypothetical protein Ddye_015597 [Dipteronia dyeriana]
MHDSSLAWWQGQLRNRNATRIGTSSVRAGALAAMVLLYGLAEALLGVPKATLGVGIRGFGEWRREGLWHLGNQTHIANGGFDDIFATWEIREIRVPMRNWGRKSEQLENNRTSCDKNVKKDMRQNFSFLYMRANLVI